MKHKLIFRKTIPGQGYVFPRSWKDKVVLTSDKRYFITICEEVEETEDKPKVAFGVFYPPQGGPLRFDVKEVAPNLLRIYHAAGKARLSLAREEAGILSELLRQILMDDYSNELLPIEQPHTDAGKEFYPPTGDSLSEFYDEELEISKRFEGVE